MKEDSEACYNLIVKKDILISNVSSGLEILTALSGIVLVIYLVFASDSRIILKNALDFGFRYQPLGILFFIILLCWFFILASAALFPFAVRSDARKTYGIRHLYSMAAMGLGPWIDVLVISLKDGFSAVNIDRVGVLYLGTGTIAMMLAALSGRAISTKGALIIASVALSGFAVFYAGLWVVGGMGSLINILVWHGIMLYSGFSAFREWLWFIREKRT